MFLRCFVRKSKYDPLVDEVDLIEANPTYAYIRHPDGRESTVNLRDLAPCTPAVVTPDVEPLVMDDALPDISYDLLNDDVVDEGGLQQPPGDTGVPAAEGNTTTSIPVVPRSSSRMNKGQARERLIETI